MPAIKLVIIILPLMFTDNFSSTLTKNVLQANQKFCLIAVNPLNHIAKAASVKDND
jgi:hypothetical protein